MKLANALSNRADIQKRIAQLQVRLNNNAKVQENEKPSEDPKALLKELDGLFNELETLVSRINKTNNLTVSDGVSLTEMIAKRDCLKQKISIMRSFLDNASAKVDRYSNKEIKIESTVEVSALQKTVDKLSKQLRETDEKIQELNWTTELI